MGVDYANSAQFVATLSTWGVDIDPKDLEVIKDMMVS